MFVPICDILGWEVTAIKLPVEKTCHEINKLEGGFVPDYKNPVKFRWKLFIV